MSNMQFETELHVHELNFFLMRPRTIRLLHTVPRSRWVAFFRLHWRPFTVMMPFFVDMTPLPESPMSLPCCASAEAREVNADID
jgi:hypothetical protein